MSCTRCAKPATLKCSKCNVYQFCSSECTKKMRKVHNAHCMEFSPADDMILLRASIPSTHPLAQEYEGIENHFDPSALVWAQSVLKTIEGPGIIDRFKLLTSEGVQRHYKLLLSPYGVKYYLERLGELDPEENKQFIAEMKTAVNNLEKGNLPYFSEHRIQFEKLKDQIRQLQESD